MMISGVEEAVSAITQGGRRRRFRLEGGYFVRG
jgi:hypothetical protein